MLKKISVLELVPGMFMERIEGRWIDHPFWKSSFLLTSREEVSRIRQSGITHVWIDISQGIDVPSVPVTLASHIDVSQAQAELHAWSTALAQSSPGPLSESRSMREELEQASQLCRKGKQRVMSMFNEARMGASLDAQGCLDLVHDITESVNRHRSALISLARLKSRDDYTYMHSVAVCALMVSLGQQIGLDEMTCCEAGLAGLLHDLGKAKVPLDILNKPGRLTNDEFELIKTHARLGHEILAAEGVPDSVLDACLHHHERMDGKGYPDCLSQPHISQLSRMCTICDVYDAITSNRPYKAGWDPAESLSRMASWTGHFDINLLQSFVKLLGIYPIGSLVRLQSGYLAVVIEQGGGSLTRPVVKTFYSLNTQMPTSPVRLDLSRSADTIVCRENTKSWGFEHLDDLWMHDMRS